MHITRGTVSALVIAYLALLGAHAANAQVVTCPGHVKADNGPCVLAARGASERLVVRVENPAGTPVAGAVASFTASSGTVTNTATTDAEGFAIATWKADASTGDADVVIGVSITAGGVKVGRIAFLAKPSVRDNGIAIAIGHGDEQSWFTSKQLRWPVIADIPGVTEAQCAQTIVAFKPLSAGAEASPDSIRGEWEKDEKRCEAPTRWKLGATVGDQFMKANVVGSTATPVIFRAGSRKEPWLAAGLMHTYMPGYKTMVKTPIVATVARKFGDTTITSTRSTDSLSVGDAAGAWVSTPTLGVNTPLLNRWTRIRFSVSTDARDVGSDWFVGISALQWFHRLWAEDMGVDVHFALHFQKRDVVTNATSCANALTTCQVDSRFGVGGGGTIQFNAGAFLSAVTGLFPK